MSTTTSAVALPSVRLTSLDQFRGYTIFGMLLVNFLGSYGVCPRLLKHSNDYCSYADTIMPQFLFAAGFAMRLSLGRRRDVNGKIPWDRVLRRILGLAAVAIAWYTICDLNDILKSFRAKPPGEFLLILLKREYFQTLMHIAATSLWILPVVILSPKFRIAYAIASGALHLLVSWWFNFVWVFSDPSAIDGGPLGFLSWAIPALCGTLTCDAVRSAGPAAALRILLCGIAAMFLGWGLSFGTVLYNVKPDQDPDRTGEAALVRTRNAATGKAKDSKLAPDPVIPSVERWRAYDGTIVEPPFVPPPDARHRQWNYWMMSQRAGSLSYLTFASGVSMVIFAMFLWACDRMNWRLGLFRTLGTNSLVAYIFHDIAGWILSPLFPKESVAVTTAIASWASFINTHLAIEIEQSKFLLQLAFALLGFLCFASLVYVVCRVLERFGLYVRV